MESLSSLKSQSWLSWFLRGILFLGFLLLFGRLFELQIIRGKYFRSLSEGNRIRRVPIVAPRGEILARGGEVLVGNKEKKKALVFDGDSGYEKTAETSDLSGENLITDLEKTAGSKPAGESSSDMSSEEDVITEWERVYTYGSVTGHITGYLGEVNSEELGKIKGLCPEKGPRLMGGIVGRTGLEEKYECLLSGFDGEELVEVDARGKKVRTLGRRKAKAGESIKTTIDAGLQEKIASSMAGRRGAVVASDPTGEILALYSSPSFDPNFFVESDKEEIGKLMKDKNLPLFNRTIGGAFHPGSIFKPIVALAGLEEGVIDKNFKYDDEGLITINSIYGSFSYKNWYFTQYGGKEGLIDLPRALSRSTDTFFYKVGELVGIDNIYKWSKKLGLDQKTGIDLTSESVGLVPNPEWKLANKGERWFLGNTYHVSIGQGDLTLTPLAIQTAITAISNNGEYCPPHILSNVPGTNENKPECKNLGLKKENIELIKKGMTEACESGGTAFPFFSFKEHSGVTVACKTGTAQNEVGEPHAWFTIFAPVEKPEIIMTVLVENGGEGSKVAAPIAREVFDYYFKVPVSPSPTPTPTNN